MNALEIIMQNRIVSSYISAAKLAAFDAGVEPPGDGEIVTALLVGYLAQRQAEQVVFGSPIIDKFLIPQAGQVEQLYEAALQNAIAELREKCIFDKPVMQ